MKRFFSWWRVHGKVLLGLCLLTLLLWQWRFERIGPNLIPDHACESLEHWTQGKTISPELARADGDGLVLTKRRNQSNFSLSRPLAKAEGVNYVAVTCDASWEGVVPHPLIGWLTPRVAIAGYDETNRFSSPMDRDVLVATGTKNWHRLQAVVELPVHMKKMVISIDGYGEEGVLRLRGLRVEAVRQRAWFVPATILLLGSWAWVLSRLLLPQIRGRWVQTRAFLIACGILCGVWFFVFPQGRTMFPSLIGGFVMGPVISSAAEASTQLSPEKPVEPPPAVVSPARSPRLRTIPPVTEKVEIPALPDVPKKAEVSPATVPVMAATPMREEFSLGIWLRELDRRWNWKKYNLTHFTAFLGIGLFLFGCAGSARIWPLPFGIAVLGEIIPNLIYHSWDRGDWWDLTANVSGLLLSLGIILLFQRIRRRLKKRMSARRTALGQDAGPEDLEVL